MPGRLPASQQATDVTSMHARCGCGRVSWKRMAPAPPVEAEAGAVATKELHGQGSWNSTLARVLPATIFAWRSALAFLDAARESRLAARLFEASEMRLLRASASSSLALRAAFSSLTSWIHCPAVKPQRIVVAAPRPPKLLSTSCGLTGRHAVRVQACMCGLGPHRFLCMGLSLSSFDGLRSLALLRLPSPELLLYR